MIPGREIVSALSDVTAHIMWAGLVVGILSAAGACAMSAVGRSSFPAFAIWTGALLASSTGVAIGQWAPVIVVAVAGVAAYAAGGFLRAALSPRRWVAGDRGRVSVAAYAGGAAPTVSE